MRPPTTPPPSGSRRSNRRQGRLTQIGRRNRRASSSGNSHRFSGRLHNLSRKLPRERMRRNRARKNQRRKATPRRKRTKRRNADGSGLNFNHRGTAHASLPSLNFYTYSLTTARNL